MSQYRKLDYGWHWLREDYRQCLIRIREKVRDMWKGEKEPPLAYFTPHGPEHCQAVEDLIYQLIPGNLAEEFEEEERFFLLASAWLHDVGMLRSVYQKIYHQKHASDFEIRDSHQITAERFIIEHYHECGLANVIDQHNRSEYRYAIATICKYHRKKEGINLCPETLSIGYKSYRIRLLAAYLRLADALHMDSSRVPDYAYALCLAYNIPAVSKMHWIKSKLIQGVTIDHKNCTLTVSFRLPTIDQMKERNIEGSQVLEKINFIINQVMDDLCEELASVMHVLAKGRLAYYLDVRAEKVSGYMEEQTLTDLLSMVTNYDILKNPSASRLMEMVLMAIANMSGYYLADNKEAKQVSVMMGSEIKREVTGFLGQIEENLLRKRCCHYGLITLVQRCHDLAKTLLPDKRESFIQEIQSLYQEHYQDKKKIRDNGKAFFEEYTQMAGDQQADASKVKYNILLFGYSNLVIRAICGFRDYLITQKYPNYNSDPGTENRTCYYEAFEEEFSEQFRIFICDGQPKTEVSLTNKILYHDGFSYANELIKKNFKNIILIPDIIAGNVMEMNDPKIDLIMLGANGFTQKSFKHAAGHLSLIKLRHQQNSLTSITNKVVLVVSGDKYLDTDETKENPSGIKTDNDHADPWGYHFWRPNNVSIRDNIWFLQDEDIKKLKDRMLFYNPREDKISFEYVDYVISDVGCFSITPDQENSEKNKESFFEKLRKKNRRQSHGSIGKIIEPYPKPIRE